MEQWSAKHERLARVLTIASGCVWLADGTREVVRKAWLAGVLRAGTGVVLIVFSGAFWRSIAARSNQRPVSAKQEARTEWLLTHPIQASITTGTAWGLLCGMFTGVVTGEWLLSLAVWLCAGLLGFGPLFVYLMRRNSSSSSR
jgi:hypothetical protein